MLLEFNNRVKDFEAVCGSRVRKEREAYILFRVWV